MHHIIGPMAMIYFWQTSAIFQLQKSDFDLYRGSLIFQTAQIRQISKKKNNTSCQISLFVLSCIQQGKSLSSSSEGQAKVERMKSYFTSCCMSLQR